MIPRRFVVSESVETVENVNSTVTNDNVKRILSLLKSGEAAINMQGHRDVTLIIGMTGSGKSTLTHFLASNNDELISKDLGVKTGEYVIIDTNDKISSKNTIISKTTQPELVYDHDTKTAYVDTPGFGDSRDEAYDIATAYFIKKVIENVDNVKIVLTVSYPSLRTGGSRNDFVQLLAHVSVLFGDLQKYTDSVALVATKVDNSYDTNEDTGVTTMVSDTSIVTNIAAFLNEVKNSLKVVQDSNPIFDSPTLRKNKETFFKNSNTLLGALLAQNDKTFSRIQIFRRPNRPGKVSVIKLLQTSKKLIADMINNLKYSPIDKSLIGYSISDKSKNMIRELTIEINENITADLASIEEILTDHFEDLERSMFDDDMYALRDQLKSSYELLSQITKIDNSASAEQMVSLLKANMPPACIFASRHFLDDIVILGKFLTFAQELSAQKFNSLVWSWTPELQQGIAYVENLLKWYDFLAALHKRLSEYEIQKSRGTFTIPVFPPGTRPLKDIPSFAQFFKQTSNQNILDVISWNSLGQTVIDDIKIRYFNRVIESTLKSATSFTTYINGDRLQATGEFVKVSEIVKHPSYDASKSLQILATRAIFLDADIRQENDISIIAPRWEIIGSRLIDLNGAQGEHHLRQKADNGGCNGCKGSDGLPGNPGHSAGHFFGVGKEFVNLQSLKITLKGGAGGTGQHGGDGKKGKDTNNAALSKWGPFSCSEGETCSAEHSYYLDSGRTFCYALSVDLTLKKYSLPGGKGGDCGLGGAAGLGGYQGNVTLISFENDPSRYISEQAHGSLGLFGIHGEAGAGGAGGVNSWSKYHIHDDKYPLDYSDGISGYASSGPMGSCPSYSSERTSNVKGRREPITRDFLRSPSDVITDYRIQLTNNLQDPLKKRYSMTFYKLLQSDHILEYDQIEHISAEYEKLKSSKIDTQTKTKLFNFMRQRIARFHEKTTTSAESTPRKRLPTSLSVALTSEMIRPKNHPKSDLIVRIRPYLDLLNNADVHRIYEQIDAAARQRINHIDNLLQNTLLDVIDLSEHIVRELVDSSYKGNVVQSRSLLVSYKLVSGFTKVVNFLRLTNALVSADLRVMRGIQIKEALPSIRVTYEPSNEHPLRQIITSIVETSTCEVEAEAIISAISQQRKRFDSSEIELELINDLLLELERDLTYAKFSVTKSTLQHFYQKLQQVNTMLLTHAENAIVDVARTLDDHIKLIQFDPNLHHKLSTDGDVEQVAKVANDLSTIPGINVEDEIHKAVHMVENNIQGDKYKPQDPTTHWQEILNALISISHQIRSCRHNADITDEVRLVAENLHELILLQATLYEDTLPNHHDRDFLLRLQSYSNNENSSDNKVLFYEYERLMESVQKYVFPLDIISNHTLPSSSFSNTHLDKKTLSTNVDQLKTTLDAFKQTTKEITIEDDLTNESNNGPIFQWSSKRYQTSISKLLKGRMIQLQATNTNRTRELAKFSSIRGKFRLDDPKQQFDLDNQLSNFTLAMIHGGNSHFYVCGDPYSVNSDFTKFVRGFNNASEETNPVQQDSDTSVDEPILSPYSTWIFQLVPVHENVTFRELDPYRKLNVDFLLEGRVKYVNLRNNTACSKIKRKLFENDDESYDSATPLIQEQTNMTPLVQEQTNTTPLVQEQTNTTPLVQDQTSDRNPEFIEIPYEEDSLEDTSLPEDDDEEYQRKRKRRHVDFSTKTSGTRFSNWFNPFNYFIKEDNPIRNLNQQDVPPSLRWDKKSPQDIPFRSFDLHGSLLLADLLVRNITKQKTHRHYVKSPNADEARILALNILDDFEALLQKLSNHKQPPSPDLPEMDPITIIKVLERSIMTGDIPSMKKTLLDSLPSGTATKVINKKTDEILHQHLIEPEIQPNGIKDVETTGNRFDWPFNTDYPNVKEVSTPNFNSSNALLK